MRRVFGDFVAVKKERTPLYTGVKETYTVPRRTKALSRTRGVSHSITVLPPTPLVGVAVPQRTLGVTVILADRQLNRFMTAADMCERYKRFVTVNSITLTLKEGCSDEQALNDLRRLLEHPENPSKQEIVAMFIPGVKELSYVDPDIIFVSDGKCETALAGVLQRGGYVFDFTAKIFHDARLIRLQESREATP